LKESRMAPSARRESSAPPRTLGPVAIVGIDHLEVSGREQRWLKCPPNVAD